MLRPLDKDPGEALAIAVENNEPKDRHNNCHSYARRIQEHMIQENVYDHWAKQH